MLAFTATKLMTPTATVEHPLVLVAEGKFVEITVQQAWPVPAGTQTLDLDDSADALPAVERLLARHGVTRYYPTTVTAPLDTTLRALGRLADAIELRMHADK